MHIKQWFSEKTSCGKPLAGVECIEDKDITQDTITQVTCIECLRVFRFYLQLANALQRPEQKGDVCESSL